MQVCGLNKVDSQNECRRLLDYLHATIAICLLRRRCMEFGEDDSRRKKHV